MYSLRAFPSSFMYRSGSYPVGFRSGSARRFLRWQKACCRRLDDDEELEKVVFECVHTMFPLQCCNVYKAIGSSCRVSIMEGTCVLINI